MGANPVFPPQHQTAASAHEELLHIVRRDPRQFGHPQSRWTLRLLGQQCPWLQGLSEGGLSQVLRRLGLSLKRGRLYVHSPDPYYEAKRAYIQTCWRQVQQAPERYVLVYQDEVTYYRQPLVGRDYEACGSPMPLARQSLQANTHFRGIGALNPLTGQLTYRQHSKAGLRQLSNFYAALCADYPQAERIFVVQDNWPIHFHPDVLARLQPQLFPWPPRLSPAWPQTPSARAVVDNLPIQLLFLPTYASWLNPIEKLWRWLKQDVLYLHRLSEDWPTLRQLVEDFMAQFRHGSTALLSYTGLLSD